MWIFKILIQVYPYFVHANFLLCIHALHSHSDIFFNCATVRVMRCIRKTGVLPLDELIQSPSEYCCPRLSRISMRWRTRQGVKEGWKALKVRLPAGSRHSGIALLHRRRDGSIVPVRKVEESYVKDELTMKLTHVIALNLIIRQKSVSRNHKE